MAEIFNRVELLMGAPYMKRVGEVRVILFGVGGVGSWCAESLIRSGVRHLTLVDSDVVCVTNVNRQLMATSRTIGQVKVEALKVHLLDINPEAEIATIHKLYTEETADEFRIEDYDYVVDAIDSLKDKVSLILRATQLTKNDRTKTFFSSMGAALRTDPFAIRKAEFWEVQGDPLARMLRKRFKHLDRYPARKFVCVYSQEVPRQNMGDMEALTSEEPPSGKAQTNGTMSHVTVIFGSALAGLILQDVEKRMLADLQGAE